MATINLSHAQLLNLTPSWYWIVSDRVGEFDDVLLRPIRNMDLVRAQTRQWFERKECLDPAGPDTQLSDLWCDILGTLAQAGEDVARLYQWGRALDADMLVTLSHSQENSDGSIDPVAHRTAAALATQRPWIDTLGYWKPDVLAFEDQDGPDLRDTLYASYEAEVLAPWRDLKQRIAHEKSAWLKMENRRTAWDAYLWEKWFGAFLYDPARVVRDGFLMMKTREWWREISPTLSKAQLAQLMHWHEKAARARDGDGFLKQDQIGPLDEALMIADIPPFQTHAARPKEWGTA